MSWADDIRCLYCDGRLPLYRKITNGQFCSSAHRKAYWQEQERLAVERLHQTHDSLRAYRPAGGVESILGRAAAAEIQEAELTPVPAPAPMPLAAEAMIEEIDFSIATAPQLPALPQVVEEKDRPWWLLLVNTDQVPEGSYIKERTGYRPRWPSDGLAGSNPSPLDYSRSLRRPLALYDLYECEFEQAEAVGLALGSAKAPVSAVNPAELAPLPVAMDVAMDPACRLNFEITPEEFELTPEAPAEEIPPFARLISLNQITLNQIRALESTAFLVQSIVPADIVLRTHLPLDAAMRNATFAPAALLHAGLRQIPMDCMSAAPGPCVESALAVDLRAEMEAPLFTLSIPPARPRLRLASGRRYAVPNLPGPAPAKIFDTSALAAKAPGVSFPKRSDAVPVVSTAMQEPAPAGMLSLAVKTRPSAPAIEIRQAPAALSLPQPVRLDPIRPRARLEPLRPRPVAEMEPETTLPMPPAPVEQQRLEPTGQERANIWIHAIDFWNRAPRDLKILTFALPVLLGLALHPSLPKMRVTAPAQTSGLERNFRRAMSEKFVNVRQTVLDRAAIALDEDFRSGLDDWASPGDASTDWSFDATGFVRPGPLAIYRPTMNLNDYQVQFLGMIDKKAMSWVARAADFQNFYVMKLVVLKGGPLPTIGLTRYAVVNGKADSRVDTIVPVDAREDMLYRVRLDVHDTEFSLSVQGQMVDSWSEPRLTHGGIGFFSAKGEESRLRWVQITHQYDMLGRLCAYLAPYNFTSSNNGMTSTSGSWQQ